MTSLFICTLHLFIYLYTLIVYLHTSLVYLYTLIVYLYTSFVYLYTLFIYLYTSFVYLYTSFVYLYTLFVYLYTSVGMYLTTLIIIRIMLNWLELWVYEFLMTLPLGLAHIIDTGTPGISSEIPVGVFFFSWTVVVMGILSWCQWFSWHYIWPLVLFLLPPLSRIQDVPTGGSRSLPPALVSGSVPSKVPSSFLGRHGYLAGMYNSYSQCWVCYRSTCIVSLQDTDLCINSCVCHWSFLVTNVTAVFKLISEDQHVCRKYNNYILFARISVQTLMHNITSCL
jgi:hypothetical protein